MIRYLLDTNVVIFVLNDDLRLSANLRDAIRAGRNFISVASYWEITIKRMRGNLIIDSPDSWWRDTLTLLAASPLLILPRHVERLLDLPPLHKDPFDRILIAQAIAEDLTLITADDQIARYSSEAFKVLC